MKLEKQLQQLQQEKKEMLDRFEQERKEMLKHLERPNITMENCNNTTTTTNNVIVTQLDQYKLFEPILNQFKKLVESLPSITLPELENQIEVDPDITCKMTI